MRAAEVSKRKLYFCRKLTILTVFRKSRQFLQNQEKLHFWGTWGYDIICHHSYGCAGCPEGSWGGRGNYLVFRDQSLQIMDGSCLDAGWMVTPFVSPGRVGLGPPLYDPHLSLSPHHDPPPPAHHVAAQSAHHVMYPANQIVGNHVTCRIPLVSPNTPLK